MRRRACGGYRGIRGGSKIECLVNEPILNDLPVCGLPHRERGGSGIRPRVQPFQRRRKGGVEPFRRAASKSVESGEYKGVGRCGAPSWGVAGGVAGSGAARPSPRRADAPACTLRELACGRHACRSGWWRCPSGLGCPVSRANPLRLRAYAWRMNGAGYADEGSPPR